VNQRTRADWLLLVGFCLFLFFYGLGQFGLIGADEPRYAQIAREMLEHRDWITPTLGGRPWLEKPPLYYWQAMLAYVVFGVSDWAARLPSAIDATLIVLGVYLFLQRLRAGAHLDGALMTASAAGIVGFARAASTDMPLAATFTLALLAWYAWWETSRKLWLAGFYVFLAFATLAKGPVAPFLAGAIVFLFAVFAKDSRIVLKTIWIPGLILFFLIALPWYVEVQIHNPEFFHAFILEQNLARFGTNLYHHKQPFWYFIPVTALGLVPWIVFVIVACTETVQVWWSERKALFESGDALNVFLLFWLLVPVIFFSLSQSKLPGYILPALPAGTLLTSEYLRRHVEENQPASLWILVLHSLVAAAPVVPALMIGHLLLQHRLPWGKGTAIASAVALALAIGIALTLRSKLGLRMLRFLTLIPVVIAVGALLKIGAFQLDEALSARPIAKQLAQMETRPMPVAVFGTRREVQYGLAFYRNQIIPRYESQPIPLDEHVVVAPTGSRDALANFVGNRRVSYLGTFAPQNLDYYWVAAANSVK
jgi:4-amino-4-deoxy-L-arabinose transferase-like glycosyltransferase